jgi:hypothetical protein
MAPRLALDDPAVMNTLMRRPTGDPLMRAYRLSGTTSGRQPTIHDMVRRRMAELSGSSDSGHAATPTQNQSSATR